MIKHKDTHFSRISKTCKYIIGNTLLTYAYCKINLDSIWELHLDNLLPILPPPQKICGFLLLHTEILL